MEPTNSNYSIFAEQYPIRPSEAAKQKHLQEEAMVKELIGQLVTYDGNPYSAFGTEEGRIFAPKQTVDGGFGAIKVVPHKVLQSKMLKRLLDKDPVVAGEPSHVDLRGNILDKYGRQLETNSMYEARQKVIKEVKDKFQGGTITKNMESPFEDEILFRAGTKVTDSVMDKLLEAGFSPETFESYMTKAKSHLRILK